MIETEKILSELIVLIHFLPTSELNSETFLGTSYKLDKFNQKPYCIGAGASPLESTCPEEKRYLDQDIK